MITELSSLAETAEQIQSGRLSPLELVEFCLARIRRLDDQIHAWVLVDEEGARRAAQECATAVGGGKWRGPLHGIPVGIKDIIDVEGFPTKAGSPLRENHVAEDDAALVARLRDCGAIILGKTVTTQFAGFDPPPTRNPWNLAHTPGGSSSGSAAAVALQMCHVAIGTQTGGSITRPAAYCGVAGLKPRFGGVSLEGVVPLSRHLDHAGPIARTAADLRVFWHAYQHQPEGALPAPLEEVFVARRPRLLRLDHFFFWNEADPDVREAAQSALLALERAGAGVMSVPVASTFDDVRQMHRRMMAFEAAEYHHQEYAAHPRAYAPQMSALIEEGLALTNVEYADALRHRRHFQRDLLRLGSVFANSHPHDVLVTPAASSTAPASRETTGDPKFNSPWSYSGLSTVCIPCALSPGGLPCGLQLVGLGDEFSLLDTAAWCEANLDFRAVPPMLSESIKQET